MVNGVAPKIQVISLFFLNTKTIHIKFESIVSLPF